MSNTTEPDDEFVRVMRGPLLTAAFFTCAAIIGDKVTTSIVHHLDSEVRLLSYATLIIPPFLISLLMSLHSEKKRWEERKRKETREAEEAAKSRSRRLNSLSYQVHSACESSVTAFESLPASLSEAKKRLPEACKHFDNAAYSPFWHTIEQAYIALGAYNQSLKEIDNLLQRYTEDVQSYSDMGGSNALPVFPVSIDAANAADAARDTSARLEEIVYQAQRDPVFAQIWEQRRTTAAVIAGFASLEAAIDRMSSTLGSSLSSLSSDLHSLSAQVGGASVEFLQASARAEAIAHSQLAEQKELRNRMDEAVFYLKEGHKRAVELR